MIDRLAHCTCDTCRAFHAQRFERLPSVVAHSASDFAASPRLTADTITDEPTCTACRGTGTAGGHRCTSYECCGPCEECEGTGIADLEVCADCGGSTAVGTPDPHECASAPLTADTITNEQIRELRATLQAELDAAPPHVWTGAVEAGLRTCDIALSGAPLGGEAEHDALWARARARCVEIIQARHEIDARRSKA